MSFKFAFITSQAFSLYNFRGSLIREMVDQGIQVYALAPDYDDKSRRAVSELGAEPVDCFMSRTGMNPLLDFFGLWKLSRQLKKLELNSTLAYFIKPVIYGTLAAAFANVPKRYAIIEGAGYVFNDGENISWKRKVLRFMVTKLYAWSLYYADRVFLLNRDDQELFVNEGMVNPDKVDLLNGIGVDLQHFMPRPCPMGFPSFIMIGRLLRDKGVYEYVKAAKIVKESYPECQFYLVGDVDLNPASVKKVELQSWCEEGILIWPGQVEDVRDWLERASVFVLPSYYREGIPRSTMEAMAMAKPVITTDAVGCKETVEEGVNGYKIPVRDPDALAKAMLKFIAGRESIIHMGLASRRMAESKFDVKNINRRILSTILR